MIKKNKRKLLVSSIVILLPILFGVIIWNRLPEQVATHWGMDGSADGWTDRCFAVLGIPLFILFVHWFCVFFTAKDPKNKNQSNKVFGMVLWICPITSVCMNILIYATALGKKLEPNFIVSLLMGFLLVMMGNYLPKCKQNSTIGIRVKWTLESEKNWNATHRVCGKVWVIGGVLMLICSFLPEMYARNTLLTLILVLSFLPIGYSYYLHKKA